jgi:hypothetical protein
MATEDDIPIPAQPRSTPSTSSSLTEASVSNLVLDKVEEIIRKGGDERGSMRLAAIATQLFKMDEIRSYFSNRELPQKKGKWIVDIISQESARFGYKNGGPGLEDINLKGFIGKPREPRPDRDQRTLKSKTTFQSRGDDKESPVGPASVEDAQALADAIASVFQTVGRNSRDVSTLCLDLHRSFPQFRSKYPYKFGQVVLSVARSNPRFRVDGNTIYSNNGSMGETKPRFEKFDKKPHPPRSYANALTSVDDEQPGAFQNQYQPEPTSSGGSAATVQHRQLYPIYSPYYFSDVPSSLPFTLYETAYTVEFEIATFGLEVKNVSFGTRALRVDLQPHKNLSQANYHQPLGTQLPSLLVFISPDEFAEVISFVPGASTISIRFVRKN